MAATKIWPIECPDCDTQLRLDIPCGCGPERILSHRDIMPEWGEILVIAEDSRLWLTHVADCADCAEGIAHYEYCKPEPAED